MLGFLSPIQPTDRRSHWEASADLPSTSPDSLIHLAASQLGVTV